MPATARASKAPLAVAKLENEGRFEGRVLASYPKENRHGAPQVYTTLEQRIRRPDGKFKVSYNVVSFVLFNAAASEWERLIKVGDHVRVYFRATGWRPPKSRRFAVSLQIECFRKYTHADENLEAWTEDEGFWNPPQIEGFQFEEDSENE